MITRFRPVGEDFMTSDSKGDYVAWRDVKDMVALYEACGVFVSLLDKLTHPCKIDENKKT